MDQVERVARALSLNQRNRARMALGHDPVTDCGDSWKHWVDEARAAIEAMTASTGGVTEEMIEAGRATLFDNSIRDYSEMAKAVYLNMNLAARPCQHCGAPEVEHEPSGCCGDGGGSTFEAMSAPSAEAKGLREAGE